MLFQQECFTAPGGVLQARKVGTLSILHWPLASPMESRLCWGGW